MNNLHHKPMNAAQPRHAREEIRTRREYRACANAVYPSELFLSRLEGEMCRGLRMRQASSPRRLLLPAAAALVLFAIMLGVVARQAGREPVPSSDLWSATPATASEALPRRETAMSEEEAQSRVLEVDMDAATAENIFTFPCGESDGAFALVRQTLDDDTMTTSGRVWYVTPTSAWLLTQKEIIWDWTLDIDSFSPEIFYICHGEGTDRSALAWTVLGGRPVEIKNASKIFALYSTRGALEGHAAFQDYDVAFLGVDVSDPENVYLYQIEGIELTREQFLTFPGAQEVIELVEGDGVYSIDQILYWQDCAMALNFMQDDLERTTYLYFVDGKLQCRGGWFGDDIGLGSGRATPFRDLPIPVRYTQLTPQTE